MFVSRSTLSTLCYKIYHIYKIDKGDLGLYMTENYLFGQIYKFLILFQGISHIFIYPTIKYCHFESQHSNRQTSLIDRNMVTALPL